MCHRDDWKGRGRGVVGRRRRGGEGRGCIFFSILDVLRGMYSFYFCVDIIVNEG